MCQVYCLTWYHLFPIFPGMARPRTNIERKQTGIRLQPRIYRSIQHYAIDAEQSVSEVMEQALEEFLQRQGVELPPLEFLPEK